jgi:hypothetical protein
MSLGGSYGEGMIEVLLYAPTCRCRANMAQMYMEDIQGQVLALRFMLGSIAYCQVSPLRSEAASGNELMLSFSNVFLPRCIRSHDKKML